ncbi:GntR family transcriptional regulator [Streptomyces goshikiensis]|uniref:GntR family transcriptional regulator n=1 Tax=Streptomyces goshikiensis TaxID=1942 RepID=UPI00367931AB
MSNGIGYPEIASYFRQKIQEGELQEGDTLPSLTQVCEQFQVATTTANRAYRVLKDEGLTTPKPGVGTIVAAHAPTYRSGAARVERIDNGGKGLLSGESAVEHIAGMRSVDDIAIAEALGVDLRDEIAVRTRVFVRGGKRRAYAVSCYHPRAVAAIPELPVPGAIPGEWHQLYLERTGVEVYRSPERYSARIANPDELRRLHLPDEASSAHAVLVVSTVFHDENGPLAYWEDVYAPGLSHVAKT